MSTESLSKAPKIGLDSGKACGVCVALGELRVAGEFAHDESERPQPFLELGDDLLRERLEGRDVDGLVIRQLRGERAGVVRAVEATRQLQNTEQRDLARQSKVTYEYPKIYMPKDTRMKTMELEQR